MSNPKRYCAFVRLCLLSFVAISVAITGHFTAVAQAPPPPPPPLFGPNVYVMTPSMTPAAINAQLNTLNQEAQFSTNRYAVLFQPGTYGTASNPVMAQVGYYEQISGISENPTNVIINGGFSADQLIDGNMTQNFWRSQENMTVIPSGGLTPGVLDWGVSQGASFRRMNIEGGLWFANSGPVNGANACQESSGGFMADTVVSNLVNSCSQQQWYTRNSDLYGGFHSFVWNFVFSGVIPANTPAQSYPNGATGLVNVTNLANTPVSVEKPFIFIDGSGNYNVFRPTLLTNSSGTSWSSSYNGTGFSLPIGTFFIATPSTSLADINTALASSEGLILTPGIYKYSAPINVTQPDTIVLGMGYATIVPQAGTPAITVADVDGVRISGLVIDAGPVSSQVLLEVGEPGVINASHASDPTVLSDVFFRIGGSTAGSANTSLQVDSANVILDNIWAWRADHGNAGTVGWTVNTAAHGLIVNGNNVTALGLAVEHYQQEQVLWNGNNGTTIFYQSELPYDPPNQAAWTNGIQNGYPSYVVSPGSACTHSAYGLGIYSFFNLGVNIIDDNAITVPNVNGINITDAGTVFLNGSGQISNVVNGTGGPANSSKSGTLNPLTAYEPIGPCTSTALPVGSTVPEETISNSNPHNLDAVNVMGAIFTPHSDLVLLSAHRGVHALAGRNDSGVPENSLTALKIAAQDGWEMVELDVKLTSDDTPILSHDRTWGREWCSYNAFFTDQTPYDPFTQPGNSNNDAKNPLVSSQTVPDTRWSYLDNTVLRDSVSILKGNNGLYEHGCSVTSHSVIFGEWAPTLQDVYDYIKDNHIHMVLALDVQAIDVAKRTWAVVQENTDDLKRPSYLTTLMKMPSTLFPDGPAEFVNTFGTNYDNINFVPVITTSAIAPVNGTATPDTEDAGFDVEDIGTAGFGGEPAIISWLQAFESFTSIKIPAVEVGLKEGGGILSSVLTAARTNASTGLPMSIGQFNPVGEYYPPDNSNTNQTPQFFRSTNGSCCDVLTHYLYNNPDNKGKQDPTQPADYSDQRPNLPFIISSNNQYVITDDPGALEAALGTGKRNICYMQAGYVSGSCTTNSTSSGPANGIYTITNGNSGLSMDVTGNSKATSANIDQYTANGGANQQWQLTSLGSGLYTLVAVSSGLCLDVKAGSTQTGATIDQYTCNSSYTNQQFRIAASNDGNYTIVALNSGLAVEIPGSATELSTVLDQYTIDGTPTQEWIFHVAAPATGTYTITNVNSGLAMDVTGGSTSISAIVDQYTALAGATNQQWKLTYLSPALYSLVSVKSGLCLDVTAGSKQTGAGIDQYTCNATYTNQQFTVAPASVGGWTIVGKGSGLAVEVPGSSTALSKPLDQWTINQGKNQAWTFTPVN
jgi:glycerophosphoryl diester phosphodiesterase